MNMPVHNFCTDKKKIIKLFYIKNENIFARRVKKLQQHCRNCNSGRNGPSFSSHKTTTYFWIARDELLFFVHFKK